MTTRRMKGWISVFILGLGAIVILFPLLWLLSAAFKPSVDAFNGQLIPHHPTLQNFRQILAASASVPVLRWLGNSLLAATVASVVVMTIDSLAAFALARLKFFGQRVIFLGLIASLTVPFIALLIPLYIEFADLNWLNTFYALILPYGANAFGVFLLYQFFLGIPKELEEAAVLDGASKFQLWHKVFLPLSIPAIVTLGLLTFMNVYNDFFWPLVATTSLHMRTLTVGVAIMAIGSYSTNYSLLMALTMFSVVPMLLAFIFAQKQLAQGIATTGLSG